MPLTASEIAKYSAKEKSLHCEVHRTFANRGVRNSQGYQAWKNACEAFHRYKSPLEKFWRIEFKIAVESGDQEATNELLTFLELDPYHYRSGYLKTRLLRIIKNSPRTKLDESRLRNIIWNRALGENRREFRDYCRLAAHLSTPAFRFIVSNKAIGTPTWKIKMLHSYLS